jgi:hypothetical protein
MTDISASRTAQVFPASLAAVLMVSLGTSFSLPSDASTASVWQGLTAQKEDSRAATAQRSTPFQIVRSSTPETQSPEWREELPWQARLLASTEVNQLVNAALEELQTEEALELFETRASAFLDLHGVAGIAALETHLLRSRGDPAVEPLARRVLRALGNVRAPAIDTVARHVLFSQLSSSSGGRRSAAASALGAFPSLTTLVALEQRAAVEKNRIVLATLQAHIRVFKANGLSSAKAV